MAYSEILHWLNGHGDYLTGVGLFRKYGNNSTLLNLFLQTENSLTREELRLALQDLVDSAAGDETPASLPKQKTVQVFNPEDFEALSETVWFKIDVTKLPPPLKKLWQKKSAITEEQKALFYRLELFPTDAERLRANLRILDIEDERQAMWQIFNKWHETGRYDEPEKPKPLTEEEISTNIRRLTVRISKLKKRKNKQPLRDELIRERDLLKKQLKNGAV